jgi:8-oxo-dGTP pyrophosphatase MutT (NUDIX family)
MNPEYIKLKKNLFCNNCAKTNHEFKDCRDPVTSYGIILVNLDYNLTDFKTKFLENIKKDGIKTELDEYGIKVSSLKDIEKFSRYSNSINFLMIQRKHTLGYIEFIRGRFRIDNIDGIIYLFQQMTSDEIQNIAKYDFDKLWNDFWGNNQLTNINIQNEYEKSKEKFMILKNEEDELSLSFYVNNVIPAWKQAEWGFPKGRRNKQEDNIICAKREFQEESDYKDDEFTVLENVSPVIEDFIGTNGVKYRHVYYIAINHKDPEKIIINNENIYQNSEIGDIKFLSYDDALKIIRPYHTAKKKVLTTVYMYLLDCIIKNTN